MNKLIVAKERFRRAVICLGAILTLPLCGCEALAPETLGEFAADFARSALAAWLL